MNDGKRIDVIVIFHSPIKHYIMTYKLTFKHRTLPKSVVVQRTSDKLQKAIDYFAPLGYDASVVLLSTSNIT